jgi:hypothetical protein
MNTKEIISSTGETVEYGRQYIEQQLEILRLDAAKRIAITTSGLITIVVLALLVLLITVFLSIALGFLLGRILEDYALAFLLVAVIYFISTLIVIKFKRQLITNPLLNTILQNILD